MPTYFTEETEKAIIEYNSSSDHKERSNIYEKKIHYPFFKLTQNLIHSFKFYNTDVENLEDLQHEVIVFLLDKIHLFDPKKSLEKNIKKILGDECDELQNNLLLKEKIKESDINEFINNIKAHPDYTKLTEESKKALEKLYIPKAYSYFGTIAKNYLILYNQKNYEKRINALNIDNIKDNTNYERYYSDDNNKITKDKQSLFMDQFIEYCKNNINNIFCDPVDIKVANAILEILSQRKNLINTQKKAIYIYIRNMLDVNTPKITKVLNRLANYIYYPNYNVFLEEGYIEFKDYKYL